MEYRFLWFVSTCNNDLEASSISLVSLWANIKFFPEPTGELYGWLWQLLFLHTTQWISLELRQTADERRWLATEMWLICIRELWESSEAESGEESVFEITYKLHYVLLEKKGKYHGRQSMLFDCI